ncbi:MAG: hypothetical protein Q8O41_09165 [Candidatus Methanoperedens sp.]|nr:hypothetical protein [Candidatus Methanoperedens sp.]
MEKAEQHIQSEDIRNAPIFLDWNDICNADMNELYAIGCIRRCGDEKI